VKVWIVEACVLAGAVALSIVVAIDDVLPGDARALREVQTWAFPGDGLSDVVRAVTTTWVVLLTGIGASVALWLAGMRREAIALAVVILVLPFLQAGIKDVVDRPRPSPAMFEVRGSVTSESFPAGHVMSPTALYLPLLAWSLRTGWHPWLRVAVVAWCIAVLALTGIVNVWLGVHWPTDVIGGYMWGAALALPAIAFGGGTSGSAYVERSLTQGQRF
jgi:undecaprenyl-diphosphatase